jgi:ACS family hexuronate transporter-like MFS transporter
MSVDIPDLRLPGRSRHWKWWVCGLLLLATTINYMDRLTLNQLSVPIMKAFDLDARGYAQLEAAFANAFALGAIVMGWLVDRWGARWIYPAAVLAWSLAGFATGLAQTFAVLLLCRFLLGLAEAGNWPCALTTTRQILPPAERTLGNSILQSGAAVGAIITPVLLLGLYTWTGSWRVPFLAVGAAGSVWVVFWLTAVRTGDLKTTPAAGNSSLLYVLGWLIALQVADGAVHVMAGASGPSLASKALATVLGILGVFVWLWRVTRDDDGLPRGVFFARFWVLAVTVVMINSTWHFFRAWMPLFLGEQHGYTLAEVSWFSSAYYVSTDAGSLAAGFAALALCRKGLPVHRSRMLVFTFCALLTTLSLIAAVLPGGPLLLGILLVIGFGALGLFPAYYSFSQELTARHQGKLTGALGCVCWLAMSLLQEAAGDLVKRTGSYSQGVALAGLAPLIALAALVLFWGSAAAAKHPEQVEPEVPAIPAEDERVFTAQPGIRQPSEA